MKKLFGYRWLQLDKEKVEKQDTIIRTEKVEITYVVPGHEVKGRHTATINRF
jgi:hypothetical protein